jgi:signal transduction histidine kinase
MGYPMIFCLKKISYKENLHMKVVFKTILLFFFLTKTLFLFSQKNTEKNIFEEEISNNSNQFLTKYNFKKAQGFFLQNNWDSTLVYSMKQLSIQTKNLELKNYCFFFRGFSLKKKKLFNESKNEFKRISNNFIFYHYVRMYLGEIALEQKEFKKAIGYFKDLEQLKSRQLIGLRIMNINHNLGLCYLHLEEFDRAEPYLLESVKLQEKQNDSLTLVGAYGDLANLYYLQYKDNLAIPYFEKAYKLSKKSKNFQLMQNAALNMAVVEENRKIFSKALIYRKEFEQWRDSLNDQDKVWEVAKLEKQFAVKQKQKEVSLLQAENKIKITERNRMFYSAIVLLLLLGTAIYFYSEKIKTNKIIQAQKEVLDELNATKDKLFSIVSHDLRSSVYAMKRSNAKLQENLETKNFKELGKQLHNNSSIANGAYNLLDNLLHWALLQTKQIYFNKESLRLFFIVEQVAYNYKPLMLDKKIYFENKVSKNELVFVDQESLKIILRNLLDNAIKFSKLNGLITIYSQNSNIASCELVIEDIGLGMNETTRLRLLKETLLLSKKKNKDIVGTGLGLQLSKSMIEKNGGKLRIESEEYIGTKMIILLPKTQKHG